jgi:glycosyltransferase involved in cell wall biosynthesis
MQSSDDLLVSVVVPVWNPGRYLERCIRSLLAQTVADTDLEILLVDDGSTDGTSERLDELAADHPQIRVRHEPASGWAGRPRNIGIEMARGRWIQFVDQDDALTPDALRRLTELGDRSAADIVLGKVTSDWRPVDHDVFRYDRTDANLSNAPLIKSLTPHKMFRTRFLHEHGLRFPEGRRRLEDQLFMVRAYLAAGNVAILGSYECYRYLRRDDGGNSGSQRIFAKSYYRDLEEVLDAVEEGTEPGALRDAMRKRFLHSEVLRRAIDRQVVGWTPQRRRSFIPVLRSLVERRFPVEMHSTMAAIDRAGLRLLADNDGAGLLELAEWAAQIRPKIKVVGTERRRHGTDLRVAVTIVGAGGRPLLLSGTDGGWVFSGPDLPRGLVELDGPDLVADIDAASLEVLAVQRGTRQAWFVSSEWTSSVVAEPGADSGRLVFEGVVHLDNETEAGTPFPAGLWGLRIRVRLFGLSRNEPLRLAEQLRPRARSLLSSFSRRR